MTRPGFKNHIKNFVHKINRDHQQKMCDQFDFYLLIIMILKKLIFFIEILTRIVPSDQKTQKNNFFLNINLINFKNHGFRNQSKNFEPYK